MVPSVLAGHLLYLAHRDRPLFETLDFIVKQLLALQGQAAVPSPTPNPEPLNINSKFFPFQELVSGGREDRTMYEEIEPGRFMPVLDRSSFTWPQITADQAAYQLGDLYYNRVSTDAARVIRGILPSVHGRRGLIVNVGTQRLTINHEDAAATATNRILCVGSANIVLLQNDMAFIWRDNLSDRWRAAKL